MRNGFVGFIAAMAYVALVVVLFHDQEDLYSGLAMFSFVIMLAVAYRLDARDRRAGRLPLLEYEKEAIREAEASSKPLGPVPPARASEDAPARRAS